MRKRARFKPVDEAEIQRYEIHRAIADRNVDAMRKAINALYHIELKSTGQGQRCQAHVPSIYAPTVEACIVAHILAPGTKLSDELSINFQNLHRTFDVPHEDYLSIRAQIEELTDEGSLVQDWCSGTCMHGLVQPFRYRDLFPATPSST